MKTGRPERNVAEEPEMTVRDLFDILERWDAPMARIVVRDENDEPIRMVVAIEGREECGDIINALDQAEQEWENDPGV